MVSSVGGVVTGSVGVVMGGGDDGGGKVGGSRVAR